jgi:hypothetical protein
VIALACLAGLITLCKVVGPSIRSWRVERAIAHFEERPSQARADVLAGLLQNYTATAEQGSRILTLLRRPTITTRPTYAADRPVGIALEQPFHLALRDTSWRRERLETVEGQDRGIAEAGGAALPRTTLLYGLRADQANPGVHRLTVRGTYSVGFWRPRSTTGKHWVNRLLQELGLSTGWHRSRILGEGRQPDRVYGCEFEMPFEVTVVPEEEAETVALVSSPQLDEAMANAFEMGLRRRLRSRRTDSGQRRYSTSEEIRYRDLPMAVALQLTLHLADESGRTSSLKAPEPLVVQAGASGSRSFSYWFERPDACTGTYTGKLVLHPDPEAAYRDPEIKAIWGGTLELPISFAVGR